jgi:YidC/Oxa1 family membrane protein insertase
MDFLISPLVNLLLIFYSVLGSSFAGHRRHDHPGAISHPALTLPQQRSMRKMNALQPQLRNCRRNMPKPAEAIRRTDEAVREYGVNPLGGCLPLILQLFIMIAFYQAITSALAATRCRCWDCRSGRAELCFALADQFAVLWLDLSQPDPYYILPILVVVTTPAAKMMSPTGADPSQASMTRQMNIMMPLMFGLFALQFASGLSIYFIVSNLVGIAQYRLIGRQPAAATATGGKPQPAKAKPAAKK